MTRSSCALLIARVLLALATLALLGAWLAQFTNGALLGLSQAHLFADAQTLALLALGLFADAYWHRGEARAVTESH